MICDQVDPAYSLTRSTVRLIILPEVNPIFALLLFPRAFSILASILASMHKCGLLRIRTDVSCILILDADDVINSRQEKHACRVNRKSAGFTFSPPF